MPIREYECPECGLRKARLESMNADYAGPWCGDCEQDMERVISAPHVNVIGGTPMHHQRAPRT